LAVELTVLYRKGSRGDADQKCGEKAVSHGPADDVSQGL
jgi:hypothetical protein